MGKLRRHRLSSGALGHPIQTAPDLGDHARFHLALGAVSVGALIFRVAYVLAMRHHFSAPDGLYYHLAAVQLRNGHAFVNPFTLAPAAFHPPIWTLVLAIPPVLGHNGQLAAQLLAAGIGVLSVVAVGFAGRRITSDRGGIIAALIAAAYPGFWASEQGLLSETLVLLEVAVLILVAYRYIAEPSRSKAALLGALCGLLALTRSEQVLLVPALVVPLILGWRWRGITRRRVEFLAIAIAIAAVVIMPWTLYNVGRLDEPVLLSTGFGSALAQGNCDPVYYGQNLGSFDIQCQGRLAADAAAHGSKTPFADAALRAAAIRYMKNHLSRVPEVLVAREARAWSLYKPFATAKAQYQFPQHPWWPATLDLYFYWALIPFAVGGAFVLHRRRLTLIPLLASFVVTSVTVATIYGEPRLRAAAEVPLVLLAAAGIDRVRRGRSGRDSATDDTTPDAPAKAVPASGAI